VNLKTRIFSGQFEVAVPKDAYVGGGSNFGVVFEFVIRLYPHSGNVFGGFLAFKPEKIPDIITAYSKLEPFRPDMAIWLGASAPGNETFAMVVPFLDTQDLAAAKEFFADFYALEPVLDLTGIRTYSEMNAILDPMMVTPIPLWR
jgi:hypothetical protein